MARITIEDCLEKIDNHFKLVLIASHRAQQLQAGVAPKIEAGNEKPTIIALREIAENLVDEDILNEPLVKDPNAEEELAELIAHGLMNHATPSDFNNMSEDLEEEESMDTLETGPKTMEEMEKIADLNLDHLKVGDDAPSEEDKALANKLSESEITIGEKLLSEAGEMAGNTNEGVAASETVQAQPEAESGTPSEEETEGGAAEKKPA